MYNIIPIDMIWMWCLREGIRTYLRTTILRYIYIYIYVYIYIFLKLSTWLKIRSCPHGWKSEAGLKPVRLTSWKWPDLTILEADNILVCRAYLVHLSIRIIKLIYILLDFIVKFFSEHSERRGMRKWSQSIQIIKISFAVFFH